MSNQLIAALFSSVLLMGCGTEASQEPDVGAIPEKVENAEAVVEESPAPAESEAANEEAPDAAGPNLKKPETFTETAPAVFKVKFETTKGEITVEAHRDWAPLGVDRFYNMVVAGYFVETPFFRVVPGTYAQFGIHADPNITDVWLDATLKDEPVLQGNTRGRLTFAMGGPNSRSAQFFFNLKDSSWLDNRGFGAIAEVTDGMNVVDALYSGYGDCAPNGNGPPQEQVIYEGNAFLKKEFTKLDYINRASIVE
jgi:peptidyl-prolyl cis-trans isomerase A (cyclophilin A)